MADIYFGAYQSPVAEVTGEWDNINNWYLAEGEGGKNGFPATPLNRFPNPATDTVVMKYDVTSGVGVYTGTYPNGTWQYGTYPGPVNFGRFSAKNTTWSGLLINPYIFECGTFTGTLSISPLHTIYVAGGNLSALTIQPNTVIEYLAFYNTHPFYNGEDRFTRPDLMILPTNWNNLKPKQAVFFRPFTYNYSIDSIKRLNIYNQYGSPNQTNGELAVFTNPTILQDMTQLSISTYKPSSPTTTTIKTLSSIFPNVTSITSPITGGELGLTNIAIDIPTVFYTGGGVNYTFNNYNTSTEIIYDKLLLKQIQGASTPLYGNLNSGVPTPGRMSYRPTVVIDIKNTNLETKFLIDTKELPFHHKFGTIANTTFIPNITLNSIKNTLGGVE
jgi:hypothetical protein